MNIRGRLLLTAAAALALPIAVQAAPPVVIGDGSVCMAADPAFPASGSSQKRAFVIARMIIDTPGKLDRCRPKLRCQSGEQGCHDLPKPAKSIEIEYQAPAPDDVTVNRQKVTMTQQQANLILDLGGADFSNFTPHPQFGRKRIFLLGGAVASITVDGEKFDCSTNPCRITLLDK